MVTQTKFTYIVGINGVYKLLHETYDGKFFTNTHIVGEVKEISTEEANKLTFFKDDCKTG